MHRPPKGDSKFETEKETDRQTPNRSDRAATHRQPPSLPLLFALLVRNRHGIRDVDRSLTMYLFRSPLAILADNPPVSEPSNRRPRAFASLCH